MEPTAHLPIFERGLGRVTLAIKSSLHRAFQRRPETPLDHTCWQDALLTAAGPRIGESRSLSALGYAQSPHPDIPADVITGLAAVHGLFVPEAVTALQRICAQLEAHAGNSDWIISRRTSGITELSPFISEMMSSRSFLLAVSRIAGVPLVPYPMVNARSQINYFYPRKDEGLCEQLGMWHTDGTNYVLNIVLSAQSEYTGGEFLFHNGTIETFDREAEDRRTIKSASLAEPGDALFIYGSRLFHGVRPVKTGRRMSLVLSFHCPYAREDSNRFWHLASDDGIPATVPNWFNLRRTLNRTAERQFAQWGIEPITFEELRHEKPDE